MLAMVSYSRRPQSGHITCYLNRTYHVLLTPTEYWVDVIPAIKHAYPDFRFIAEAYWDLE